MQATIPAGCVENPHVSYLRPDQINDITDEIKVARAKLQSPYITDKGEVQEQMRRMEQQLEIQGPKPYRAEEIDRAVKREEELRQTWLNGMLSQEEMRKSPAGAPDAHRAWEKRNKPAIFEWQNIMRRLHVGTDDTEVCSIERFRPTTSVMGMHDAFIPGKQYHLPPPGAAVGVTFSAEQIAALRALDPALADKLALLNNEQRAEVKSVMGAEKMYRDMNGEERKAYKAAKAAKAS